VNVEIKMLIHKILCVMCIEKNYFIQLSVFESFK